MTEAINKTILAMMDYYRGDAKRISHFLKVHSYAKLIGELECLDTETQLTLELAAIVHDIGIKVCEEKYNSTDGSLQELEGAEPAGDILNGIINNTETIERVKFLVAHHHTYDGVDGIDYRILLEADFIVNAYEDGLSKPAVLSGRRNIFRTKSGCDILNKCFALTSIYELPKTQASFIDKFFTDHTDSCTTSFLDGRCGIAFVDDLSTPSAAAIIVGEYVYLEGNTKCTDFFKDILELAKENKMTIITLDKNIRKLLNKIHPAGFKKTIRYQMSSKPEISKKALNDNIASLPDAFELVRIKEDLYYQALGNDWSKYFVKNFKDYKDFEINGRGYAVVYNGRIVCGVSSYSVCDDGYEVMVATHPAFRRKGLAFICASRFILSCFKHGRLPYWDCANEKSFALSRKLGYTLVREYSGLMPLPG